MPESDVENDAVSPAVSVKTKVMVTESPKTGVETGVPDPNEREPSVVEPVEVRATSNGSWKLSLIHI